LLVEVLIVVVLIVVNAMFALSELAVVSSRPARLKVLAAEGRTGAAVALTLTENPGRFLSSVQAGMTLVGVLSGAFSGATLGDRLTEWLNASGFDPSLAGPAGVGLVVLVITYLQLIVGELVPKQIALRDPERIAARVAPSMAMLARITAPLVWFLDASARLVLRLVGQGGDKEERLTDEEVRTLIAEAETAGVIESEEGSMINAVMRLADRSARGLMTPRLDVELIDLSDPEAENIARLRGTRHSVLPVQGGNVDEIIGVIVRKDLIDTLFAGGTLDIRALVKPAPVVMDRSDALDVLTALRAAIVHMALVFDEYGHFEGIVTPGDVLEAITGAFQEEEGDDPAYTAREDGSYLVSGWMQVDEFGAKIGVPVPRDPRYETVAGYVLAEFQHIPGVGESFQRGGWRFEVLDLDGRRIDKVLVSPVA
jgi:putative hemolysin